MAPIKRRHTDDTSVDGEAQQSADQGQLDLGRAEEPVTYREPSVDAPLADSQAEPAEHQSSGETVPGNAGNEKRVVVRPRVGERPVRTRTETAATALPATDRAPLEATGNPVPGNSGITAGSGTREGTRGATSANATKTVRIPSRMSRQPRTPNRVMTTTTSRN